MVFVMNHIYDFIAPLGKRRNQVNHTMPANISNDSLADILAVIAIIAVIGMYADIHMQEVCHVIGLV